MKRDRDISKEHLYQAVKLLVETEGPHIHLPQHKLFTLFSIAFQYILFKSTKERGSYIVRVEDSSLADRLSSRSKDSSTRRFMQSLLLPRKLKYGHSCFYLDFFHTGSWGMTNDLKAGCIKGAIVVKNPNSRPMTELPEELQGEAGQDASLEEEAENYFLTSALQSSPRVITLAYDMELEGATEVRFPFIKRDSDRVRGLTISRDINLEEILE